MSAVRVDPPAAVLAERHRLGLDGADEMWEGELHMVPPAGSGHQMIEMGLSVVLYPIVERHGIAVLAETGHERLGVGEVLIIDPARRVIRRSRNGSDGLVEIPADAQGQVICDGLPISLRFDARKLVVTDVVSGRVRIVPARI